MFDVLLNVIAPVLICIVIGYLWGKTPTLYATDFVTRMVTNIGAPCLIIHTMNSTDMRWQEFVETAQLTVLTLVCNLALGFVVLRAFRLNFSALSLAVVMPNVGNMGLSLCLFAFGEDGLALGLIIFVVTSLVHFASGDIVLAREGSISRRLLSVTRQPLVYGAAVALLLVTTGWKLPTVLANTTQLLGGMTIPLMLITLGVSLSRLGTGNLRIGTIIACTRMLGGLAISCALVWVFGLTGLLAKVLILQSAMPSAVFNYLFALKYDRYTDAVASGVVISTFMSMLLIPVLLWFLL